VKAVPSLSRIFPTDLLNLTKMPHFTYNIVDINEISYELGIPWEASKDQPFATSTIYIGFVWNLAQCMITLSSNKTEKYINEINIWLER